MESIDMARTYFEKLCVSCGKLFMTRDTRQGKGRCCSLSCSATLASKNRNQKGAANNNWKGGVSLSYSKRKRRYEKRYPQKALAHKMVTKAIRKGTLIKKSCNQCGNKKVEAHHKDYEKPLFVIWLCKKHHLEAHDGRLNNHL